MPFETSRRQVLASLSYTSLLAGSGAGASSAGYAAVPQAGEASVTPEQFGAKGDGVADDAPALQRAFDAIAARLFGGIVVLQPRSAYRCRSGLKLDASRTSIWGQALIDFTGVDGVCLRVDASSVARGEPANNYGRKGMISGALHIRGGGRESRSIGVHFDAEAVATSAQMLVENIGISNCGTGIRFGRRAYNTLLLRCEVFNCGTCIEWPVADDNGERNTLVGCTLFNSGLGVRMANPSAAIYLLGCSIDYTGTLYDVAGGAIFATDCHHESSLWSDRPIRCRGDGAVVHVKGGWMLNQADDWKAIHVVEAGAGAEVLFDGVYLHGVAPVQRGSGTATAWATGDGAARLRSCHGFELGRFPMRLHATRTGLADPDFAARDWQDPVWRIDDTTMPIVTRVGSEGDNLRLARVRAGSGSALAVTKAYGATSPARFVLMMRPVRDGMQILAGFRVRRDPARPGRDGTVHVSPAWALIDGQDAAGAPVMTRVETVATLTLVPPADRDVVAAPLASRRARTAPEWATHFVMIVDLVQAHQASFLFTGLWCDVI